MAENNSSSGGGSEQAYMIDADERCGSAKKRRKGKGKEGRKYGEGGEVRKNGGSKSERGKRRSGLRIRSKLKMSTSKCRMWLI